MDTGSSVRRPPRVGRIGTRLEEVPPVSCSRCRPRRAPDGGLSGLRHRRGGAHARRRHRRDPDVSPPLPRGARRRARRRAAACSRIRTRGRCSSTRCTPARCSSCSPGSLPVVLNRLGARLPTDRRRRGRGRADRRGSLDRRPRARRDQHLRAKSSSSRSPRPLAAWDRPFTIGDDAHTAHLDPAPRRARRRAPPPRHRPGPRSLRRRLSAGPARQPASRRGELVALDAPERAARARRGRAARPRAGRRASGSCRSGRAPWRRA